MTAWISVKDRLPDVPGYYLVHLPYVKEKNYKITKSFHEKWKEDDGTKWEVTHWMPLPEPPEEGK